MNLAEGIRKIGFRRWYERQLIECHLYFVTGFLSLVAMAACANALDLGAGLPNILPLSLASVLTMGVSFWSLTRYITMLSFAERAAERSVCGGCQAYGALEVLKVGETPHAPESQPWLKVRCHKCGHAWLIE